MTETNDTSPLEAALPKPRKYPRVTVPIRDDAMCNTRQSFKDECDVNRIVDQFTRTGLIPNTNPLTPQYGEAPDQSFFESSCIAASVRTAVEEGKLDREPDETPETPSEDISEAVTASPGEPKIAPETTPVDEKGDQKL